MREAATTRGCSCESPPTDRDPAADVKSPMAHDVGVADWHLVDDACMCKHLQTVKWIPQQSPASKSPTSLRECDSLLQRANGNGLLCVQELALTVLRDVMRLLELGRTAVLRALLRCRQLLQGSVEYGYLFNRIWLDDYCIWLQQQPPRRIAHLAASLRTLELPKSCAGIRMTHKQHISYPHSRPCICFCIAAGG